MYAWGFVLLGQGCSGGGVGFSATDRVGVVVLYLGELFCECASEPFFFFFNNINPLYIREY